MARSPATIEPCVPSGWGTLSKLPREVRDEIYRYLVKGRYIVSGRSITADSTYQPGSAITHYQPDSTILRVSKSISDEAMSIFYSESIFNLFLRVSSQLRDMSQAPKALTDKMMRINYHIYGFGGHFPDYENAESLQPSNSKNMKAICDNTIGHLVSTDITRGHIQIILYEIRDLTHAFTSPLFQTFARLRAFRTLMLELCFSLTLNDERIDIQVASNCMQENMQAVEAYLEPALGPIANRSHGLSGKEDYYGILTFEPYQHMVDNAGLEMELEEGSVQENVGHFL